MDALPEFQYTIEELPPGRVGFRRWRWELWHGAQLLACGWRAGPHAAERALRATASRRVHELRGLEPLRPERARALARFLPGATVTVDCGISLCVLSPRGAVDERRRAAA